MNYEIQFATDTATLGIFDPQVLRHRLNDVCDWWCKDLSMIDEVRDGRIALVSLGGDGYYKVRLTDDQLLPDEECYAVVRLTTLGIEVISNKVFVGPAEYLPGEGYQCDPEGEVGKLFFVPISNGTYNLEVFGINWGDSGTWYVDPDSPVPEDAPADVVVVLRPRDGVFQAPSEEPRFTGIEDTWLFPEKLRQIGPVPGMVLTTKVVKRRDELILRPCGPLEYRPILPDMSDLQWKDVIKVKVITVDSKKEEMQVERIADDPPTKRWTRIFKGRSRYSKNSHH